MTKKKNFLKFILILILLNTTDSLSAAQDYAQTKHRLKKSK